MRLLIGLCICFFLIGAKLKAQDPHYSQFYASPLNFNPALAGTVGGTFRINTIYRDQWTTVLEDPMTSFSLGADIKLTLDDKKRNPDLLGLGISFNTDRIRTFDLNTTSVSLMAGFHKSLDERKTKYLGAGLMFGVVQRSINYEDLVFQDQFNALDAFNLPTSEAFPSNNFGFLDMGGGITYLYKHDGIRFNAGAAYYHFNRPNVSFYSEETCANCAVETENLLKPRLTAHAALTIDQSESFALSPRILIQLQEEHKEFTLGNNFILKFPEKPGTAVHLGAWVRGVQNVDGIGPESIIFLMGYQKENISFGFSYDHHLNDLITDRLGMNAFEFSITYIGEHDNSFDTCPKF